MKSLSATLAFALLGALGSAWAQEPAEAQGEPPAPPPIEEKLAPRPAETAKPETAPTLDNFKAALEPHGRWVNSERHGDVWVPNVAKDWRPYTNGRWVYTEYGWTFVAEESWGWAPFHYGRWAYLQPDGWSWIPGFEWAPAWVAWRYGGDYLGWAPLGPWGYGLGYYGYPSLWCFVPGRYFHGHGGGGRGGYGHGGPVSRHIIATRNVSGLLRNTRFAGLPRAGLYHSPSAKYVAAASGRAVHQASAARLTPSWVARGAAFNPQAALARTSATTRIAATPSGNRGGYRGTSARGGPAPDYRSYGTPSRGYRTPAYRGYGNTHRGDYGRPTYRGYNGAPAYRNPGTTTYRSPSRSSTSSPRGSSSFGGRSAPSGGGHRR